MKLFKKHVITGCESDGLRGVPYLTRWRLIETSLGAIYLHKFHRSDGKDLHDHPWAFASIILWRGYIEETPDGAQEVWEGSVAEGEAMLARNERWQYAGYGVGDSMLLVRPGRNRNRKRVWPATILFRRAKHIHRVELIDEKPAWTLIIRGPYVRTWGFWVDGIWESFKDYFVRRGC